MAEDRHVHPAVKQRQAREHAKAVKRAQEAVTAAQAAYGSEHPQTASALSDLARLHQGHSEFAQAEATFSQALAIREKNPSDVAGLAGALRDLARLYDVAGQPGKGRPLMQRAAQVESEAFEQDTDFVESAEPEYNAHADFVENMAGSAPKTFWTQTLGGLLLPFLLGLRGITLVVSGHMVIRIRGTLQALAVNGAAARLAGVVWLCAAAFAHFHFFWPYRNRTLCSYGKTVAFIVGVVLLFVTLGIMWLG